MKMDAILFHATSTLHVLTEGSATLGHLVHMDVAPGLRERLADHLAQLHNASAGAYTKPTDLANLTRLASLVEADIEEAQTYINAAPAVKARAYRGGMRGLVRGPLPPSPALVIYQRDIAPTVRQAAEVCYALHTQGKDELVQAIYARIATLLTLARRIFQQHPVTPEIQTQIDAEVAALAKVVNTIIREAQEGIKNGN